MEDHQASLSGQSTRRARASTRPDRVFASVGNDSSRVSRPVCLLFHRLLDTFLTWRGHSSWPIPVRYPPQHLHCPTKPYMAAANWEDCNYCADESFIAHAPRGAPFKLELAQPLDLHERVVRANQRQQFSRTGSDERHLPIRVDLSIDAGFVLRLRIHLWSSAIHAHE